MSFDAQSQNASTRAPFIARRHLAARVFRVLWIVGFLIGTSTHVADIVIGGINTYAEFPVALRLFWLSLTVLDSLVVVLLMMRRRSGIVLGLVVILTDISVNWTVYLTIGGNPLFGVINQTAFAILLVSTARPLWRWFTEPRPREEPPPRPEDR